MNRENLINRLVARKIESNAQGKLRAFCVCMARALCFAAGQRQAASNPKN